MANGEFTMTLDEADYRHVQEQLSKMSELEKMAAIQKALQEGVNVIVKQGKRNLKNRLSKDPVNMSRRTGRLERSMGYRTNKRKMKAYGGFRRPGGAAAHLVDRGTEKRWTKKGAYRGSVSKGSTNTGNRFWTDAFDAKKNEAMRELMDSIRATLQKLGK